MVPFACPRCTQDLCNDCFEVALSGISTSIIPVSRKPIERKVTIDDYLERKVRGRVSRDDYKYGGMGAY